MCRVCYGPSLLWAELSLNRFDPGSIRPNWSVASAYFQLQNIFAYANEEHAYNCYILLIKVCYSGYTYSNTVYIASMNQISNGTKSRTTTSFFSENFLMEGDVVLLYIRLFMTFFCMGQAHVLFWSFVAADKRPVKMNK